MTRHGLQGARLAHSHQRQWQYVRQSLMLWREERPLTQAHPTEPEGCALSPPRHFRSMRTAAAPSPKRKTPTSQFETPNPKPSNPKPSANAAQSKPARVR